MDELYLTREQLAAKWNIKVKTLDQWRWMGKGPVYFKVGKTIYYWPRDIRAFEMSKRRRSTSGPPISLTEEQDESDLKNPFPFLSTPKKKGDR